MKNLFPSPIVKVPEGLNGTNIYDLLTRLDNAFLNGIILRSGKELDGYQIKFEKEDEFSAIRTAVEFFYKKPESTEEEAEIDMNYLSMLILSCKSTRLFGYILLNGFFNISGYLNDPPNPDFITTDTSNPYNIVVNIDEVVAGDTTEFEEVFDEMLNHLLYFHDISKFIEKFIQAYEVAFVTQTLTTSMNINSVYYEPYSTI